MSSPPPNLLDIKHRKGIKQSHDGMLDSSIDVYEDNSIQANTSDETSSPIIFEPESFRATKNVQRSSSTLHTVGKGPTRQSDYSNLRPNKSSVYSKEPQFVLWYCIVFIALGILATVMGMYIFRETAALEECTYDKLQQRYPVQDPKVWRSISINIENILNRRSTQPAVYLFVHQGGKGMLRLVRDIAAETADCFGGKMELVEMSHNDFTSSDAMEDYGYAIEKFKEKIKNGHVALIVNLNEIPAVAARALHTICDTHTPIANSIVIFLTLVTPQSSGNPVENAENTLMKLWSSKLKSNEIDALITRVTDEVIALKSQ